MVDSQFHNNRWLGRQGAFPMACDLIKQSRIELASDLSDSDTLAHASRGVWLLPDFL
jgi:hypothetical protein